MTMDAAAINVNVWHIISPFGPLGRKIGRDWGNVLRVLESLRQARFSTVSATERVTAAAAQHALAGLD